MNKLRLPLMAIAIMAFTLLVSSAAQAQATRTWVSGVGDDVNPCSRTAPCKTFAGAISKTADGGEISVLDPGGYGTLTITKGITVDGGTGAGWGSTLASGTSGFIINETTNTKNVTLRNLSINGGNTGISGIRFLTGKVLHIENCQIFNFKGSGVNSHGIDINLNASTTGAHRVIVENTIIRQNTGDGIIVRNANASAVNLLVQNSLIVQNNNGITFGLNSRSFVKNSTVSNNTLVGMVSAAGNLGVDLDSNFVSSNATGLSLVAGTTRIGGNRIVNHGTGVNFAGGTLVTYGDNKIDGNTNDAVGGVIPPPIAKK